MAERKRAEENYLRIIYELEKEEGARSIDVAKQLKISKASVSEMLKKLSERGFVKAKPYSNIFLTDKGWDRAREISKKYKILEKFAKKLGHTQAENEAHELEHHFSEEMIDKLDQFVEGKLKIQQEMPSYIS